MQAPFSDPFSGIELASTPLPLVGREMEMQIVHSMLTGVARGVQGGPQAIIISGDIGIGKSLLLEETCRAASDLNFTVLAGRAYESGCMFPYLPFIEALRPVLRAASLAELRSYVGLDTEPGEQAPEDISLTGLPLVTAFSQLFPDICRRLQVTPLREILSPDQEKFRLFDALATLLERMAQKRPVLFCLDDLHWADSASLELTLYLTMRLHASPVMLLGATRPPQTDAASSSTAAAPGALKILRELMQQGFLLLLPLRPLNEHEAELHLHNLLPGLLPETLALHLIERAEGNPFFLEELVRMLCLNGQLILRDGTWQMNAPAKTWELPPRVTLAVQQRLQGLACRELLQVAALFGRTFPLQALVRVLALPEARAQELVEEALQARLVTRIAPASQAWESPGEIGPQERGPSLHFCQGIVQEVLAEEVPAHRQRQLHGAIGEALEEYYGPLAPLHAAELARQYGLSGRQEAALIWSLRAGEDAVRQQAHREAISHLRIALRLLETGVSLPAGTATYFPAQLSLALGESWLKLGELEQAARAFQQALEQSPPDAEGRSSEELFVRARACRLLADAYRLQGKYELALAQLQAATSLLDEENRKRTQKAAAEHEPVLASWLVPGYHALQPTPLAGLEGQAGMTSQLRANERLLLLQARATLDLLLYRFGEAEKTLWQTHQLAAEIGDRGSQAFALHILGWLRGWGEHIGEAIRLISQAHELYLALGDPFHAALGDQSLGIIYQAIGEMEQAERYNLQGFERARRYGVQHILGWLHCNQGTMALARGAWAEGESHFHSALAEGEKLGNARIRPLALQGLAMLHFRRGDWQSAEQIFQQAIQAAQNTEWYPGTLALYGHFLAVTGCRAAAQAQLDLAAAQDEPFGYSGDFYLPFLAEGYLHLESKYLSTRYVERIRNLRGFLYYGVSVDRILGEIAAVQEDWQAAEQAFENGLALCRRSQNQPEEAAILYEQARTALMRSRSGPQAENARLEQRVQELCEQARELFERYDMQRSVALVDTLREGLRQIEERKGRREDLPLVVAPHLAHADYRLDLHLTRRELEVLRLVAEGRTDREVADILVLSPRTVNRHLSNIFVKLDVPGRAAAVAYAIRQRLVE
jgi:DNA-binding CsgD family transcriptional regulator/predicted negative regulator of RcsB-dependent stress response